MNRYSPQLFSAIFLVAGTCIGGGMLALPVATGHAGFFPSLFVMMLAWLAMMCTALYFIEVIFWLKRDDAHVISMASEFLGRPGKIIAWILYLFVCYASLVAYTAGGGHLVASAIHRITSLEISNASGCLIVILFFGPAIFLSHKALGKINSILFIAMVITYAIIIFVGVQAVKPEFLLRQNWQVSWLALPLLLTAFSFQTMVPSLYSFLGHNAPSLRIAIIGGTSVAFIVYTLWQLVVLGTVPLEGEHGLASALEKGLIATHHFAFHLERPWIEWISSGFAFFALITSFFGISLGLYDFLSDGLHIPKQGKGNVLLSLLIIVPTLFFAISYERIFLLALDTTGGFGDAILNGIMPILMVWIGRYFLLKGKTRFQVPGGKWLLSSAFIFYLGAVILELCMRINS